MKKSLISLTIFWLLLSCNQSEKKVVANGTKLAANDTAIPSQQKDTAAIKNKRQILMFSIVLILTVVLASAQSTTTEVGFITDNDLYTSLTNDKYYTNRLEFFYSFLARNNNEKVNKKISEFRFGQYIYTPYTIKADDAATNDRPFAGYLFVEAGRNIFYQKESVFKADFQLGFIGKNSFAREVQQEFHNFVGFESVHGWQNQIKNSLVVQTHFVYSMKLFPIKRCKYIDFNFQSEANLGTIFTGTSAGFLTRISFKKLNPIYDSNIYGASINTNRQYKQSEFYFYLAPSINWQLYDATIQGSLFNDKSPVVYNLIPFRFSGEASLKYRKKILIYHTLLFTKAKS